MLKNKSILIVNKAQYGYHIDTYYYCKNLSKNNQVTYVCFDEGNKRIESGNVRVLYCEWNGSIIERALRYLTSIYKTYVNTKPDAVFIKYFLGSTFLLLFLHRSRTIMDIRTASVALKSRKRVALDFILRLEVKLFKHVTVISEGLKQRLKLSKNSTVLPLGAIEISSKAKTYDSIKLLYVGTLNNRNVPVTIEAVAKFVKTISSNISYQIVGFGSDSEVKDVQSAIIHNCMESTVSFEGRVDVNSLGPYFERNNVGIAYIPIKDYYMHQPPTKIFEYSMSGLITIATKTTINESLIDDKNGVVCQDTMDGVFSALRQVHVDLVKYDYFEIKESLGAFEWGRIVKCNLEPIIRRVCNEI